MAEPFVNKIFWTFPTQCSIIFSNWKVEFSVLILDENILFTLKAK